jgi:excisionase family DNA binding protein
MQSLGGMENLVSENWLELSEAAQILDLHPSTVRRWADAGKIKHRRTPGGRRQFDRSTIENIRKEMQEFNPQSPTEQIESKTRDFARQHVSELSSWQQGWLTRLNEEQLMIFRYSGQRLLGLVMQYISRNDDAETFLEEAKRIARDYSSIFYNIGLSISQSAEAFLFFRRSILELVQATSGLGGVNDPDGLRIFLRTSDFYDALLLAAIENYVRLSQS